MKVALVTGAAQGLGLVTASVFAKLGLRVILSDVQDLAVVTGRLRKSGAEVEAARGDISSEAFVRDLAARIEREHRALDVLVNNAGISLIAPAEHTTAARFARARRHRASHSFSGRRRKERIHQRHDLERGRRLDCGRELGEVADGNASE
jgi:NAD(P)-dependent dehydrogenase (short-subunit alcohol dehydrogenase family)